MTKRLITILKNNTASLYAIYLNLNFTNINVLQDQLTYNLSIYALTKVFNKVIMIYLRYSNVFSFFCTIF